MWCSLGNATVIIGNKSDLESRRQVQAHERWNPYQWSGSNHGSLPFLKFKIYEWLASICHGIQYCLLKGTMAQSLKSNLVTCNIFNMCEKSSTLERLYCGYLNQRVIYLQKKMNKKYWSGWGRMLNCGAMILRNTEHINNTQIWLNNILSGLVADRDSNSCSLQMWNMRCD